MKTDLNDNTKEKLVISTLKLKLSYTGKIKG